jgi:hypothetical protein
VNNENLVSIAGNWREGRAPDAPVRTEPPGANADLIFRMTADAVFSNAANATYASITVSPFYENTITLKRNVAFSGAGTGQESTIQGGTIDGLLVEGRTMTFSGSPLTIVGGSFVGFKLINAPQNVITMTQGRTEWENVQIDNSGTFNWSESATLNLVRSEFQNIGTLNISATGKGAITGNLSEFENQQGGVVQVTGATTDPEIAVRDFTNSGTMRFGGGSTTTFRVTSFSQTAGVTELSGGSVVKIRTPGQTVGRIDVTGGTVAGAGTIDGNLRMADGNEARTIHPGVGNAPGVLTLDGNLTMSARTTIAISIDANGNIGTLNVRRQVDFGGSVIAVDRNAGFLPALRDTLFFFDAATSIGNLGEPVFRPALNAWNNGGNAVRFAVINQRVIPAQVPPFGRTRTYLEVVQQAGGNANANLGNPALLAAFENDPDLNGPINVTKVEGNANNVGQAIQTANDNSFMALEDGSCDFVAATDFVGEDEVQYAVSDGETEKNASLAIHVAETDPSVNDPEYPVDHDDDLDIDDDDYSDGLLDNAHNFDPDNVEISEVNGDDANVGEATATTEGGSVTVNANGTFLYAAPTNFVGIDTFTVTVSDGDATETMTVSINCINTYAADPVFASLRDVALTVDQEHGVLTWAGDVDGDPITVTEVNDQENNVGEEVETAEGGTITIEEDGSFVYDPPTDFYGDDVVTVTISDGDSESTLTLTLHVVKVLASEAAFDGTEDTALPIDDTEGLLTFAEDAESDPLTVVAIDGNESAIGEETESARGGTVTVQSDGSFDYTPPDDFYGTDWFVYTVSDGDDHTSTAFAVIYVAAVNDAPVLTVPDAQTVNEDGALVLSPENENALSIADIDADGGLMEMSISTNMYVTLNLSGTSGLEFSEGDGTADPYMLFTGTLADINAALDGISFVPDPNWHGAYLIVDITIDDLGNTGGGSLTDEDSFTIEVNSVNDAPSGTDNTVYTSQNTDYVFSASDFGFSDSIDGDSFLAVKITSLPTNGTLYWYNGSSWVTVTAGQFISVSDLNANRLKYTPPTNYTGSPTFTFQVQDDGGTDFGGIDLDPIVNTMTINIS